LLTERALAVNPSIDSSVNKTKSFKATESATKGRLLPTAEFSLRTGNQQNDATRRTDLSTTSTFSVNVPILAKGGAEYSAIRQAKYQTKQAIIAHDDAVKKIKADCLAKWSTFYASKERVAATDEAVGAAETAYEGMMQEEMLGSKTIIDVLNAEVKLNSARSNRVEAKKELILAAYQIKALVGELTAKSMKLKVDYFDPEKEFKKVKFKIIGF
jgi:outer membrane protein